MMLVGWLISNGQLFAQDTTLVFQDSVLVQAEYITTDKLQNLYVLTPDNQIFKYNSKGQLLFKYNNENYGKPSSIDVSNPLRPFLYLNDYLKAIVLDRTMNELYEYDLSLFNVDAIVSVAAPSPDNGIWLFEDASFKIKKFSAQGQLLYESNDITQTSGIAIEPHQIIFHNNKIYLHQKETTILVFDRFGQFIEELSIETLNEIQIENEWIITHETAKNKLTFQHFNPSVKEKLILPELKSPVLQAIKSGNLIFLRMADQVLVYRF
jgi:hypothetical protein